MILTTYRFNTEAFAATVRQARGAQTLKAFHESMSDAFMDSPPSISTLSRIESGYPPDIATLATLCSFLGLNPGSFFEAAGPGARLDRIECELHRLTARIARLESEAEAHIITSSLVTEVLK
jgi:transcriptional regulator with XRE-family HTH domain